MKTFSFILLSLIITLLFVSFIRQTSQPKPWEVPSEYKNKVNAFESSTESISEGKTLYIKHCASCHGKTGIGDGPKAKLIDTFSGDLTSTAYQSQSDGEQFYKTLIGRGDMPAYKNKLSDEDIWNIVNYMRSFKK
jgi:mono/diheme cytochrome c family protein